VLSLIAPRHSILSTTTQNLNPILANLATCKICVVAIWPTWCNRCFGNFREKSYFWAEKSHYQF